MKTGFALAAATLMAFGAGAPALADDDDRRWDRRWDDRRGWNDRDEARAYREGFRDGRRGDNRRNRWQGQGWRQVDNGWRGNGWQNNGWQGNGWQGNNWRNDNWRGASVNSAAPYWWGDDGRIQCRRRDGTTGLIVGALAGGTLGNVIAGQGEKRLGSVIGGTLGAVLGNEIARGGVRCR